MIRGRERKRRVKNGFTALRRIARRVFAFEVQDYDKRVRVKRQCLIIGLKGYEMQICTLFLYLLYPYTAFGGDPIMGSSSARMIS